MKVTNNESDNTTLLEIDSTFCKVHQSACCSLKNQAIGVAEKTPRFMSCSMLSQLCFTCYYCHSFLIYQQPRKGNFVLVKGVAPVMLVAHIDTGATC